MPISLGLQGAHSQMASLRVPDGGVDYSAASPQQLRTATFGKERAMSKGDTHFGKTQAVRAYLAEHPGATPTRVIEILAARGIQVTPAHVVVAQTVLRSEQAERVVVAS